MFFIKNKTIETDKDGYLKDSSQWNTSLAEIIASKEAISLSCEHWEVVFFMRDFYFKFNTYPGIRLLVMQLASKFGKKKGNSRYLYFLFPGGPTKQVAKIAGLPKPFNCF